MQRLLTLMGLVMKIFRCYEKDIEYAIEAIHIVKKEEDVGFEPTDGFIRHTISSRASRTSSSFN